MKRSVKWAGVAATTISVLSAGFMGGRAWAGGIPSKSALTYSGVLQKPDGSPLTSAGHNLEIKLWSTGPTGGTALCDTILPAPTFMLDNSGRFSVQLDDSCTGAIAANAGAFVEVLLDGNTLGRTMLGAVPYAIEANHAAKADIATSALNANAATTSTNATNASRATSADTANALAASAVAANATHATTADNATNATHATTADNAANATHATTADNATNASDVVTSHNGTAHGVSYGWDGNLHVWIDTTDVGEFHFVQGATKTFIIAHPQDPERYLVHATLEGPENAVFYRGTATLRRGTAKIALPSYFEAATRHDNRTVLLTPKFDGNSEPVSAIAASNVENGGFEVRSIDNRNPSQAFDWEVKAVRSDVPSIDAEPERSAIVVHGDGPYKYFSTKAQ